MKPEELMVDWPLLNLIMIEEGMEPERMAKIRICFADYSRTCSSKQRFLDRLLYGGALAGIWWEERMSATIYTDKCRTLERASRTLAHELGHALDKAPGSNSHGTAWFLYLWLFLTNGLIWAVVPPIFGEGPLLLQAQSIGLRLLIFLGVFILVTRIVWLPLQKQLFYRNTKRERSAGEWTERLTSREDWGGVLTLKTGSEEKGER